MSFYEVFILSGTVLDFHIILNICILPYLILTAPSIMIPNLQIRKLKAVKAKDSCKVNELVGWSAGLQYWSVDSNPCFVTHYVTLPKIER